MQSRVRKAVSCLLVIVIMALPFQVLAMESAMDAGTGTVQGAHPMAMEMAGQTDMDCPLCHSGNCGQAGTCHIAASCTSTPLTANSSGIVIFPSYTVCRVVAAEDVLLSSLLNPTIYRPPWA